MTKKHPLLKKFYSIIDAEKARAQAENDGITDMNTVADRVREICKPFLPELERLLGTIFFNIIISRRMKHGIRLAFRNFTRNRKPESRAEEQQLVFPGMEQLRGYPAQLTYEKDGQVVFVDSRKSREFDQQKAEEYLERLIEWDKQRLRYVKNGNRFAAAARKIYGDLPLEELVQRWRADHAEPDEQQQ